MNQLKTLQAVSSHTAQVFLRELIPGAKTETSELFIALTNDRQTHYVKQSARPLAQRTQYGMHHIFLFLKKNIVRDDQVTRNEHRRLVC